MYSVIISEKDIAGMNIFSQIKKLTKEPNFEIIKISHETLYSDEIDKMAGGDFLIFATRHSSEKEKPCFCVHTPGNWSHAEFGGKTRELCISPATLQREFYLELKNQNTTSFPIMLEATHHGPFLPNKPCLFIEIGSSPKEWINEEAGSVVARTLYEVCGKKLKEKKALIGIGGPHYCDNFSKLLEKTELAIGHICPKHMLDGFTADLALMAKERTYEKDPLFALDWKGLGKNKERVQKILEKEGINYKKIKDLV